MLTTAQITKIRLLVEKAKEIKRHNIHIDTDYLVTSCTEEEKKLFFDNLLEDLNSRITKAIIDYEINR